MKTQNNTTLTYTAPEVKTVTVSTRSCILQGSINPYGDGSNSDNEGHGYDIE